MTQEEISILLKDLCARLPYGAFVQFEVDGQKTIKPLNMDVLSSANIKCFKPYLRPMSSMTEEEKTELRLEQLKDENMFLYVINKSQEGDDSLLGTVIPHYAEDWANKNHFDYRGLIPMGLALEAPEDMYHLN